MNKKWRKILLFALPPVVIVGGFIYWLMWTGTTDDIEAVADQFQPDSSWTLVQSSSNPPATICASACPSLTRNWDMDSTATQDDIINAVKRSGWADVKIRNGCDPEQVAQNGNFCTMYGFVEGYQVQIIALRSNSKSDPPTVSLHMQ